MSTVRAIEAAVRIAHTLSHPVCDCLYEVAYPSWFDRVNGGGGPGPALAGEERRHRRGKTAPPVHRMLQDFLGFRTGVPSQCDVLSVAERQ